MANLFLHYALDKWLVKNYPSLKFVRYADDAIVHCHTLKQAEHLLTAIQNRMRECVITSYSIHYTKLYEEVDYNKGNDAMNRATEIRSYIIKNFNV